MAQINQRYILLTLFSFILIFITSKSLASDSVYCLNAIKHFEKKYNIPKNFLYLISLVESGKWDENSKTVQPWPWTVHIGGKAKFFKNRGEMVMFLKKHISYGKENIDVGCNQINYKYHKHNFNSIEHMVTPYYNIEYSAYYLSQNFAKTGNWHDAIALYHSKNPLHNGRYIKKIKKAAENNGNLQMALNNVKKNSFDIPSLNTKNHKKVTLKKNFNAGIIVYDAKSVTTNTDRIIIK